MFLFGILGKINVKKLEKCTLKKKKFQRKINDMT